MTIHAKQRHRTALMLTSATSVLIGVSAPSFAAAQATSTQVAATRDYDIAAQPMNEALRAFAEASGLQLVYDTPITANKRSAAVSGRLSAQAALAQLLAGSDLAFSFSSNGAVVIAPAATAADGTRLMGTVRVEGVDGSGGSFPNAGINGSSDVTATEGTGSYTTGAMTIATKTPQSIKETPQSVSVITSERLKEQNLTDFKTALSQLTGITVTQPSNQSNLNSQFVSRGFLVSNFQIDGGAPFKIGYGFNPQIDMALYDSVQIVRGAAGLFDGYGEPSGTINLVRKKPLDHNQVLIDLQAGSWSNFRQVADITGPLAMDGRLRGRMIVINQANDYYFKVANDRRTTVTASVDFDLTPTTRLYGGFELTNQNSIPSYNGLPRYNNGDDIGFPVDTCFCTPWNRATFKTDQFFVEANQKIGSIFNINVKYTHISQKAKVKAFYVDGSINPITKTGSYAYSSESNQSSKQGGVEAVISSEFNVFGRKQLILIGGNYQNVDAGGQNNTAINYAPGFFDTTPVNLFPFNPAAFPEPAAKIPTNTQVLSGQIQYGFYARIDLSPIDNLHLISGIRYNHWKFLNQGSYNFNIPELGYVSSGTGLNYSYTGSNTSKPGLAATYNLTKKLTVFGSYTNIGQSQANSVTPDLVPLSPSTGSNYEGGLKWASADGRLNANIALYKIVQDNFAAAISNIPRYSIGVLSCCFSNNSKNKNKSKGVDLEVVGEVLRNWQVSLGYTYSKSEAIIYNSDNLTLRSDSGQPTQSQQPEHLVKFFTSYGFSSIDWLKGARIGGGINYQSKSYSAGSICPVPIAPGGYCSVRTVPYQITVKPYALVAAFVEYPLNDRFSVAINGTNIFNKRTYSSIYGFPSGGNVYVQPAAVTGTLHAKW